MAKDRLPLPMYQDLHLPPPLKHAHSRCVDRANLHQIVRRHVHCIKRCLVKTHFCNSVLWPSLTMVVSALLVADVYELIIECRYSCYTMILTNTQATSAKRSWITRSTLFNHLPILPWSSNGSPTWLILVLKWTERNLKPTTFAVGGLLDGLILWSEVEDWLVLISTSAFSSECVF